MESDDLDQSKAIGESFKLIDKVLALGKVYFGDVF
jgi:hypothetical protein